MNYKTHILARNNLVEIEDVTTRPASTEQYLATIYANLVRYGYVLSRDAAFALETLDFDMLSAWWRDLEPVLKDITGDNRQMGDFVVYKNFPQEVLDKSESEYWISQILMYWGLPNELFTEDKQPRHSLLEKLDLKVLHLADEASPEKILNTLLKSSVRWTPEQHKDATYLVKEEGICFDVPSIKFKENMAKLVSSCIHSDVSLRIKSATDVLRIAIAMSNGDVSMRKPTRFKNFSRKERRFFLSLLNDSVTSLTEDMARRKNIWKKFIKNLHPNDYMYRYPNVSLAYTCLYNDDLVTFNSTVEKFIEDVNPQVFVFLNGRAGEFTRRLQHLITVFGMDAIKAYNKVLPRLTISQLLKVQKHFNTIRDRKYRVFPPKGNWSKLRIEDNNVVIPEHFIIRLNSLIDRELFNRLVTKLGAVNLDEDTELIKLQTSDNELSSYGRGTSFKIPDNIKFIRTASYWECPTSFNSWFDNGWNFFDKNWKSMGACCWNTPHGLSGAAFSGDPTNTKDIKGRACQLIDVHLDDLAANGIRYGVWNVLCYSRIPFSDAKEVYASLQWGEKPQEGELFDPSRCQLSFPLNGECLTKYVAYLDVVERKIVYMDANLKGNVMSAGMNINVLEKTMPAFVEYLGSLPSVYDLFKNTLYGEDGTPVVYSDEDVEIDDRDAYVFMPRNKYNKFDQIDISELLVHKP